MSSGVPSATSSAPSANTFAMSNPDLMPPSAQMLAAEGRLPDRVYACVGGGSNAMGIFSGFLDDPSVELVGVEAGGHGLETGEHASRLASASRTR